MDIFLFFGIVIALYFLLTDRIQEIKRGTPIMGLNNATLVVVLKEHETGNDIYYVSQICNPDNALSYETSFLDVIFVSETFYCRKKAIERAKELEEVEQTSRGILIYDGFCSYTLGSIIDLLSKRHMYKGNHNVHAIH